MRHLLLGLALSAGVAQAQPSSAPTSEPASAPVEAPAPAAPSPAAVLLAELQRLKLRPRLLLESDFEAHPVIQEGLTGFSFSRARIGLEASPIKQAKAVLTAEFADGAPKLIDAFVRAELSRGVALSAGFNNTPLFYSFKSEEAESLAIPELSITARALTPGRDAGLELHLFPEQAPVEAWLRVGNGSGSFAGNDNPQLSFDGRLDLAFGRANRWGSRGEVFGLRAGVGHHREEAADRLGVEASLASGFVFFRPVTVSGLRQVSEAHLLLQLGPLQLLAEGGLAIEGRSRDDDGNPATPRETLEPTSSAGGAAELAWMITGEHRRSGLWPIEQPKRRFGAFEVAGRAERLKLSTRASDVTPGGATSGALALRWWYSGSLALGASGYFIAYDVAPLETPDRNSSWLGLVRATVSL